MNFVIPASTVLDTVQISLVSVGAAGGRRMESLPRTAWAFLLSSARAATAMASVAPGPEEECQAKDRREIPTRPER